MSGFGTIHRRYPRSPRPPVRRGLRVCISFALAAAMALPAGAQHHDAHDDRRWSAAAQVVPLLTHATPALRGDALTEVYLTQPVLAGEGRLWSGRLLLAGMLNLEGLTLERGELNPGIWGEGYIDRRHPHTLLHEAVATLRLGAGAGWTATVSAGKGFAPFGTDDPMARPFVKFPVNHHLAQIPERAVTIAALRIGPAVLEAGLFNGDEPEGPRSLIRLERFADSWSARATLLPVRGAELSVSRARVASPEHAGGDGLDQRKWSAAARYQGALPRLGDAYALVEWAHTADLDDGREAFYFASVLGEAALSRGPWRWAIRGERTRRPDEERLLDPFRTPRPHADVHLFGITRWDVATASASRAVEMGGGWTLRPLVEVAHLRARQTLEPVFFSPAEFYGSDRMWSLSAGVRVEVGTLHARMGRYGAALPASRSWPP